MILQEVFAPVNEAKPLSKDQMDAMDKAREQDDFVLPELEKPEPGFFDGMGEAGWKGVASSALKSASAFDTALSSTGMVRAALNNAQIETGYTFDDLDKRQSEIENRLDQDSKELRRRARDDFGVDPTTMGTAAQIIYGVAETIPKAIGYSLLAGPAGGSVLFGADLGISRSQELMDEGVDKSTAINAGLVTFGTAALGMRLPATFGRSRIASATIGAAANAGLTAAEMQGVNWVLQNQNYKELSQKYQLNGIDLATSAIFGGVMGGVLWRPDMNPSRSQTAKERSVPLQERIKRQLREASPDTISDEAIETQAVVQATGIQVMADRAQIDADAIAPEIVRGETGTTDFNQPVTQGRQWHMGSHVIGRENEDVNVVHSRFIGESDRQKAIDNLEIALKNGVENRDTGWVLTGSRSDAKKTLPPIKFRKEEPGLYDSIVEQLDEIVFQAKLVESHRDVKHGNPDVQGIHIFAVPFDFNNKNYRVQLTVRDYVGGGSQARLATHSIDSIEVLPMGESDDGIGAKAPRAPTATSPNQSETLSSPGAGLSRTWASSDTVTLSKLLPGYKRADGKSPFDPEDSSSYTERGVYFDSQSYVKNPLLTVHNISQDNLLKANQLGGLAVPSLGITRADSAYSDFGDITLIGTRGMADPANGTPVFSMDAYTNRFPEARWEKSVNRDNARAFMREYSTWEEKFGVDDGSVSYYLEREPNRDRFLREFANSPVTKQAFLETKGVTVEPEYIVPRNQTGLVKELEADFRAILDDVDDIENYQKRFSEAYADAVDRLGDNVPAFLKRRADKVRQGEVLSWDFLNPYVRAMEQPLNEAAPRIDRIATENKINAEVDKYQSEYADWVQSKTKDLFGEPTIRVGNRDLPMTLENVVLAMTRRSARNTERTLTFGAGNVRAAASKRFRSLSDIQRNRDRITDTDTVNSINKEIDDLLADFRNSVVDYYKWDGTFEKYDDAMRALADVAKGKPTKEKLRSALSKRGFNASEVPDDVLETGVNALVQLRRGMTDYFEAKPQRAVHFDEFVGAAVPEDVSPEVVSILENNGIRVQRYRADNRSDVVNRLSQQLNQERGDVFYQRAWHGSPHIFDTFSTEHIGTGEGAQAHGWGLYFAGDRKIAEGYRNRLSDRSRQFNQVLDEFEWTDLDPNEQIDYVGLSAALENGEFSPQTTELLRALEENQWLGFSTPAQAIRAALSDLSSFEATPRLQNAVEAFGDRGRVFEVDIPNEDVLLNEDLSLKDQPQKVKEAVEQIFDKYQKEDSYYYRKSIPEDFSELDENYRSGTFTVVQRLDENRERVFAIFNNEDTVKQRVRLFNEKAEHDNPTKPSDTASGRGIYQMLSRLTGSDRNASIALNNAGVRGITYDGFRDGRCYVVFDDKAIQTIDFYQNLANRNVVAEIEGTEFATEIDQAKSGKPSDLIKKAVELIKTIGDEVPLDDRLSKGTWERSINNDEIGDIRITTRGSKELRGEAIDYPENLVGLPALDAVLQHGKFEGWLPNRKKDKKPNVEAYGRLRADVLIGGEVRRVSVQLERYNNGKAYYFIETEKPSLARNFSQLSTASVEGSPSVANDTINIEVESIEPTTRGSFNPALNRITLTANANISTYSHEMGHWYLENLFQLSRRAVAENTLKEDANILLKEFGIKSVDDWDNLGVDGQRKYQEQFASWVEIYLSEGRAPKPTLQRVFERLGQWLVDLYRELGGVKKAVGDTYKAEVGEELPPVSDEVAKVLDRLFANDRAVRKASRVSKSQVAAARMVQANRTNNNKLEEIIAMPNGKEKTRALRDLEKSTKAQLKAIQAMKRGLPVDVSQDVETMNVDTDHLVEMKGNFGRAYVMGNTDSAVVLQNRDRSDVGSIGQMNAIAANPQYGLVSVSRSYSGAPVVSYGSVPDSAHLGNNDFIVETNGNRVPFMYAVVEAGDVETSNFIDGSTNTGYGNPQRMNAVVGNGRMTALKEAYNRGTANQYRADLEADTAHGIQPEVIQKMKNPVLVRVINPEDVTTGFISRSNGQQVLALDDVEVAREDAPKIRARAGQYEFDEAGNPTNDTLALFIQDLHDPNALGRLITSDGRPTPEAVRRIRNAVFFEAYQSPELSALFSQEVDPGIRRILNGLANVAPRIIELREQAQELDFSNLLVEAANRIRQARLNPEEGVDFASQMSFLDNPATSAFVEFLDDNANSAAAIARTLNPLIDWAENAARAADGGLFGGDAEVHVDLADVVGQLRNIINDQRAGAGLEPLPEIDVNALRDQIQTTVDTVAQAVDEVNAHIEAETQQAEMDIANEAQALDAQRQQSLAVLNEKSSVDARAQLMMEQNPDQVYRVLDENGMEVQGTLSDLLAQADDEVRQAEIEAAGIGRAVECVLRNGGI